MAMLTIWRDWALEQGGESSGRNRITVNNNRTNLGSESVRFTTLSMGSPPVDSPSPFPLPRTSEGVRGSDVDASAWCASVQRIKKLRIFEQDLVRERRRDVFTRPHSGHKLPLLGGILMTVIRADDQVICTCILRNILDVFVRLAGDKNAVFAEHVRVRREFPLLAE